MPNRDDIPSFRRLRAFEAAALANSLSAAAQALRLSQPALTHSVAQLEGGLGRRLFERTPEGAFLNEAGRVFHRRSERFFHQVRVALCGANGLGMDDPAIDMQASKLASAQVRSLLAIWRAGSFRAAARALGLTDPSLQRPARELEQIIGAPLYRRSALGLTVNEAGAELARRLALAIGEIRAGAEELDAASKSRASLRVGVLALAPRSLLAKAADAVLTDNGPQSIEVVEGPYSQIVRNLHDGALDVIFGALRAPPPFDELIEEPLFEDPYTIVCRRDHPLTRLAQAGAEDLAPFGWVHPTADLPRRAVLDKITVDWGLKPDINFETNCLATITALLSASDRLSILSLRHIEIDQRLERVNHPPIQHEPRHVGLTIRKNWLPTPFQFKFLEHMRHQGKNMGVDNHNGASNSKRNFS